MILQWLNSMELQGKSVLDYGCAVLPRVALCSILPWHHACARCSCCVQQQATQAQTSAIQAMSTHCDAREARCRCGTGVLGISAALLGAKRVVGLDIDPDAVHASELNAQLNSVEDQCCYYACEPVPPESLSVDDFQGADGSFDICVANIFQKDLINLRDSICRLVRPGGTIVMSGVLQRQVCAIVLIRCGCLLQHSQQHGTRGTPS